MLDILTFHAAFDELTDRWDWEVEGFINKSGYVFPIDTDTKVISTVFERLSSPVVRTIAKRHGYKVEIANQTTYPDFTMTNVKTRHRIAIDIKTTYLSWRLKLTLGGYNSFIRSETKNILHPYSSYHEHWVIGFIYKQNDAFPEYDLETMPRHGQIACPYTFVSKFIRQKHDVSGLRAGSGNTKNIGSIIATFPAEFQTTVGPFGMFTDGKGACDYYWRYYEILSPTIRTLDDLLAHPDFSTFGPSRNTE